MQAVSLSLRIRERLLVDALDWQVRPGECWCVIGRNGAGKSTLLRTLAGLRAPEGGCVRVGGRELSGWPLLELARQRAYLPQARNDTFGYRAIEIVLAARHPYQDLRYWDAGHDHEKAHAALRALDVDDLAQRDIRTLSGGERQRVAIAATLAQETPLLLLDEPANALDLAHQVQVMELVARLCRRESKAAVIVIHDLNLAYGAATHALLLMEDGRWVAGPAADVMTPPALSDCLGYPIETIRHGERTIFIPVQGAHHE